MDFSVLIAGLGFGATVVGSYVSYRLGRRSEYSVDEWMKELRDWSKDSISEMSDLIYYSHENELGHDKIVQIKSSLSCLVECGRLYFPNHYTESYGAYKLKAYHGYRHSALDCLVASIEVIDDKSIEISEKIYHYDKLRKIFVSIMIDILGPQNHNKIISEIIKKSLSDLVMKPWADFFLMVKTFRLVPRG
ncbi:hypothetical protein [Larsenimonas rhizosphaerae]|uniref:hypothetical protein n=1 Tax=Larsenimonas rhizosphaerae TaxID=2944682 RepID=UPI0020338385|nr:hypothetical protein [Larsenimonas rhizosphaerae]MCM2129415.1 hypothetical protein [Larsenimonas rhizosphaerae]